ncbi:MAG: lipid-A-disaccharide synthase [Acidobacteriota bacterium]|nr:lipid-A-disaccharide synthase [Acidobacteriota bacterium]
MSAPRVMVIAGEASGDAHAAGLVRQARLLDPSLRFEGTGGDGLEAEGVRLFHRVERLSVVGITEVFARLPALRAALGDLRRRLRESPPDLLLLVDFPDFNLMLARTARRLGVPVLYYISPQLWAWRRRRVKILEKLVRRMIVFFPFEESFYRDHGVPVSFVGHPLADDHRHHPDAAAARRALGIEPEGEVLGLLPGSRPGELRRHLAPMLEAGRLLRDRRPHTRFVLPLAAGLDAEAVTARVAASALPVKVVAGDFAAAVEACDGALVASGTASLEVAVRGVPEVVVYRTSWLTATVGRMALDIDHVSLVNLVAGREVVPELLQERFTARRAAAALLPLLDEGPARRAMLEGLADVRRRLGEPGAYRRAAQVLIGELRATTRPAREERDGR